MIKFTYAKRKISKACISIYLSRTTSICVYLVLSLIGPKGLDFHYVKCQSLLLHSLRMAYVCVGCRVYINVRGRPLTLAFAIICIPLG